MPQSSQNTIVARQRQAPRDVTVRAWPLMNGQWGPKLLLAAGVVAGWLAAIASQSPATGAVITAGVLLTLWRVWLPVRFEIGPSGVTQYCLGRQRRIAWSAIGRVERQHAGLLVLPNADPAPLESLRGLVIPFGNQQPEVLAVFEFYLEGRSH